MNFLNDGTKNVECECINRTILYGNVMIFLMISKLNYGAIDSNDNSC